MCGITGFILHSEMRDSRHLGQYLRQMTTRITHRGPDADGTWFDEEPGIYLGHRRLSILDLSPAGAQPMHSKDGRYVTVFNGEIYNFAELRRELEQHGRQFIGQIGRAHV